MWNIFSRIQRESTSTTRSSRIVITFVVLAIVHAFILALLQGEALETSRHGVNVLQAIQEAPKFSIIVGAVSSGVSFVPFATMGNGAGVDMDCV